MQTTSTAFKTMVEGNELVVEQQVTLTLPITRTNKCTTPSFENGIGTWGPAGAVAPALSVSSTQAWVPGSTHSLRAVFGSSGVANSGITQYPLKLARAGSWFAVTCMVKLDASCPALTILNGSGTNVVSTTGSWQQLHTYLNTLVAADYADLDLFIVNNAGTTAGVGYNLDGILIEEVASSSVPFGAYFDGTFANAYYAGVPDQSISVLNVDPYPDVSLAIESLTTDRQLTTDMPDGTRLVTGYPTAQTTLVLSGLVDQTDETKTAAWLLNPNETTSPLYRLPLAGSPITVKAGLVPGNGTTELLTSFTGYVDDPVIDAVAGTVTLTCLDNRTVLRSVPALPAVAAVMQVPSAVGLGGNAPGLTSLWVLDSVLRANGYYSSPGPRVGANLLFYASFAGSAYPQVYRPAGYPVFASSSAQWDDELFSATPPMQFVAGAFNTQVCRDVEINASFAQWLPQYPSATNIDLQPGGGYFHEWWMNTLWPDVSNFGGVYPATAIIVVLTDLDGNGLYGSTIGITPVTATTATLTAADGSTHTISTAQAFQQFSVQVTFGGSLGAETATTTLYLDRVLVGSWTGSISTPPAGTTADTIDIISPYTMEAFQTTNELAGVPLASFTANAVLDESLNNLFATVDLTGQDPWRVIQDLAEAELAIAGFDELGVFRFTNRQSLQTFTSQRTVTSVSSLKTAQIESGLSLVAQHVTANVNVLALSTYQAVWNANTVYQILANQTITITALLTSPACAISTLVSIIPTGGITPTQVFSGWRAAKNADGSGGAITTGVSMTVAPSTPTTIVVTLTNTNPFPVYLVTPAGAGYPVGSVGQPALAIAGSFIVAVGTSTDLTTTTSAGLLADSQWPTASEGGAPASAPALQLPDNAWRQDLPSVQSLTDDTLADLYRPRPILKNLTIVADPSLQLGDRVTINDPDGTRMLDDVVVTGITTVSSASDWTQTLTVRSISLPGSWIMGQVGRSEMGVATYA